MSLGDLTVLDLASLRIASRDYLPGAEDRHDRYEENQGAECETH